MLVNPLVSLYQKDTNQTGGRRKQKKTNPVIRDNLLSVVSHKRFSFCSPPIVKRPSDDSFQSSLYLPAIVAVAVAVGTDPSGKSPTPHRERRGGKRRETQIHDGCPLHCLSQPPPAEWKDGGGRKTSVEGGGKSGKGEEGGRRRRRSTESYVKWWLTWVPL